MNDKRNTKPRMELIEPSMLEALARVLQNGAEKYGVEGYHTVPESEFYGALLRHYTAMRRGEALDPESSLLHIEHILGNAAILVAKHHHVSRETFTIGGTVDTIKEVWLDNTKNTNSNTPDPEINQKRVTPEPVDADFSIPAKPGIASCCDSCAHGTEFDDDCGDLDGCQFRHVEVPK